MMHRNIPRTIRLPFGYTIKVEQVTKREMEDECGDFLDGAWTPEGPNGGTIRIVRSLKMTRKRYILGHEIAHAVNDWLHEHLNMGTGKP